MLIQLGQGVTKANLNNASVAHAWDTGHSTKWSDREMAKTAQELVGLAKTDQKIKVSLHIRNSESVLFDN